MVANYSLLVIKMIKNIFANVINPYFQTTSLVCSTCIIPWLVLLYREYGRYGLTEFVNACITSNNMRMRMQKANIFT